MIKKILILFVVLLILIIPLVFAEIKINSPLNKIYNSKNILFDFSSSIRGDFYLARSSDSQNGVVLCKNALSCKKIINANEGENHWWIKRTKNGVVEFSQEIEFFVNTQNLKILKTDVSGLKIGYSNGKELSVTYSSGKLKEVVLHYETDDGHEYSVINYDCPTGERKTCYFNTSLSNFDGQRIEMWFTLKDYKKIVSSKKERVLVDTTRPLINDFDYSITGNQIRFSMDIDEKNFKEIVYKDFSDCYSNGEKDGTLCTGLNSGVCISEKYICTGDHKILVIARDKARNENQQEICVKVDP